MSDSILQRYSGRPHVALGEKVHEPDSVEDLGGWGLLRSPHERALSLELRKCDDTVLGVPYALIEQFVFAPADGIKLRFAGREVQISGQGLNTSSVEQPLTLFTAMNRHRVTWVAEKSRHAKLLQPNSVVIESIRW